jgi:hypothetical protein
MNKISSAEQAMDALMKAKSKSFPVYVEFYCFGVNLSLEGQIHEISESTFRITGKEFTEQFMFADLSSCLVEGEIEDTWERFYLELSITRRISDKVLQRLLITIDSPIVDAAGSAPN